MEIFQRFLRKEIHTRSSYMLLVLIVAISQAHGGKVISLLSPSPVPIARQYSKLPPPLLHFPHAQDVVIQSEPVPVPSSRRYFSPSPSIPRCCSGMQAKASTFVAGSESAVLEYLVREFNRSEGIDLSKDRLALQSLREAAEKAKIQLSSTSQTEITLPFVATDAPGGAPKHLNITLTRSKFESLLNNNLIEKTFKEEVPLLTQKNKESKAPINIMNTADTTIHSTESSEVVPPGDGLTPPAN